MLSVTSGLNLTILFNVFSNSFISCRFAPSNTTDNGIPFSSVSTLRFVPIFSPIGRVMSCCFTCQWCFYHTAVHTLPFPTDPFFFIIFFQCHCPQFLKKSCRFPLLKIFVYAAACSVFFRHCFPLTARSQNISYPL